MENSWKNRLGLAIIVALSVSWCVSCQKSENGGPVPVPTVTFRCVTGPCTMANGAKTYVVYASQGGCANSEFGAKYSSVGTLTCASGVCNGTANQWADSAGTVSTFAADVYDFCAYIYFNGSPTSGAVSGDLKGGSEYISVASQAGTSVSISSWTLIE